MTSTSSLFDLLSIISKYEASAAVRAPVTFVLIKHFYLSLGSSTCRRGTMQHLALGSTSKILFREKFDVKWQWHWKKFLGVILVLWAPYIAMHCQQTEVFGNGIIGVQHLIKYFFTPCSSVLLEKLTGSQLVKKFSEFYGTRRFIAAFKSARACQKMVDIIRKWSNGNSRPWKSLVSPAHQGGVWKQSGWRDWYRKFVELQFEI